MAAPPTDGFKEHTRAVVKHILTVVEEVERLLLGNRIFLDRLENVGVISAEDAISLGWTGPCLRATGVAYDVRKAHPYMKYGEVEFDVPVGTTSDSYDRFMVRIAEMRQSARIIDVRGRMPTLARQRRRPRVILPPKRRSNTIEGTIQHFRS